MQTAGVVLNPFSRGHTAGIERAELGRSGVLSIPKSTEQEKRACGSIPVNTLRFRVP